MAGTTSNAALTDLTGTGKYAESEGRGAFSTDRTQTFSWYGSRAAGWFTQQYVTGLAGGFRSGGPTARDEANRDAFDEAFIAKSVRHGFAGGGATEYVHRETGLRFHVDRSANGKTFYGTQHSISEVRS